MEQVIIFCAKYLVWVSALVGAGVFVLKRSARLSIVTAWMLGGSYALSKVAEALWYNPRPFVSDGVTPLISHAADNGFPSNHTLMAAAIAIAVFYYHRTLGVILFVLAFLVGASRVAAGVHHWVDIAGAFGIVLVIAALSYVVQHTLSSWGNE